MKSLVIPAAAAALLAATAALAQPATPPAPLQPAKVQARAEVQAHVAQMFARFDANRDGFVTTAELGAAEVQRAARAGERAEQRGVRAFDRFDSNRDGQISRQEWDSGRQDRAGKRHGGMRHAGLRGGLGGRMFATADADKDGRVSLTEAQQAALARFDRADLNRDGTLTREERRQSRQQMRAQRNRG
jgi:hypothetical protein